MDKNDESIKNIYAVFFYIMSTEILYDIRVSK